MVAPFSVIDVDAAHVAAPAPDMAMYVSVTKKKSGYRLEARLWLPRSIAEVFAFFADARNLNTITPGWLQFRIVTPLPVVMRPGLLLDYRLRVHGIPVRWKSEITAWDPHHRFVDEQRKGPYRRWVHEHVFRKKDSGTEVVDRVDYAVPGGRLVHRLFVKGDVTSIFRYRRRKLVEIFQGAEGQSAGPNTLRGSRTVMMAGPVLRNTLESEGCGT